MKLVYFFLFFLFSSTALGQSIGISPAQLIFHEGQEKQQLRLFNPNDHSITYTLSVNEREDAFIFEREGEILPYSSKTVILKLNPAKVLTAFTTQLVATYHFGAEPGLGILPQATTEIYIELSKEDRIINLNEAMNEPQKNDTSDYRIGALIMVVIVACGVGLFYLVRYV